MLGDPGIDSTPERQFGTAGYKHHSAVHQTQVRSGAQLARPVRVDRVLRG